MHQVWQKNRTRQGLMDQLLYISALWNIISSKNPTEDSSCPLQDTLSPWKPEKISKHVAKFANCTEPTCCDFGTPNKNFLQTNNIKGEVSQHSDVQLQNNLNIIISKMDEN